MERIFSACIVILLFASPWVRGEQAIPLAQAVTAGQVTYSARPSGYSSLKLSLKNTKATPVTVDLFGANFVPTVGETQPLGIARLNVESGASVLTLKAGEACELSLPSFCLDSNRPGPGSDAVYHLDAKPVPREVAEIFRAWNELGAFGMGQVQSSVWQRDVQQLRKLAADIKNAFDALVRPEIMRIHGNRRPSPSR
jgi:hypothetical protein